MADISVNETKEVHISSESYMDILKSAVQVADVEESRGFELVGMAFPPPQVGGGMLLQFHRNKGGGGGDGDDPDDPVPPAARPQRLAYPFPQAGFGRFS